MKKMIGCFLAAVMASAMFAAEPAYAALRFSKSIVRESYDNNYDIDFHTAKDERGNEYIVKEVSEPSGFWFEVGVTEDQDKVMTILKEHFDVENEEKFCLGVNQTADSKYFRYLVKTPYSGDEITLEQASELYDALADETEITKFLYYEAYKMIYVLDLPSFPECGIVGMFPTDGYDKILKCVTDNDLNCEVIISDSDECWQGYQCVVSFDASAGLDERLDVFKKIYAETGLYSLAGASHGIFNFMPENYVFLTYNEEQKEQDPDHAGDKSDGMITCGDIDASGTIDITDLTELSLALVGDKELTSEQKMAADIDSDGTVTLADLARLQQYLSKKITSF